MASKFICEDCKRSRHTASGQIICTGVGVPALAFRYGKCRRFEARKKPKPTPPPQPSLFDEAGENQPSINPNNERI